MTLKFFHVQGMLSRNIFVVNLFIFCLLISACQRKGHLSTFPISSVPTQIKNLDWIKLADDQAQDGKRENSADGKAFYYHYDIQTDTLWFKLELYNEISEEKPAVSVSIDTDTDQSTGVAWYGANASYTFEKMLSVGPINKEGEMYYGYNGITNQEGVSAGDWINEKQAVLAFYTDQSGKAYFIGVKRSDISPNLQQINVIGSVGKNALWNDDIGESGYATITLPVRGENP